MNQISLLKGDLTKNLKTKMHTLLLVTHSRLCLTDCIQECSFTFMLATSGNSVGKWFGTLGKSNCIIVLKVWVKGISIDTHYYCAKYGVASSFVVESSC